MRADLLSLASDLAKQGEAFALATVVRREPPSSARVGDSALITRGGTFHGWLGGACTQPTVVREALQALADGKPRLIALSPDPAAERRTGVLALPMTCHSGGSVDIYLEPVLPTPRLVIFGLSPTAQALARLAKAVGYTVDAVDPAADRATFPEADRVLTTLDTAPLKALPGARGDQLCVVVATMGEQDEAAITAALALEPAYLGVVASHKRFAQIRETLLGADAAPATLDRIKSPAGLDIGAHSPQEIALSVLAEIVQLQRAANSAPLPPPSPPPAASSEQTARQAIDPICGMTVNTATTRHRAVFSGRTYYFCCGGCRAQFLTDPARFVAASETGGPT